MDALETIRQIKDICSKLDSGVDFSCVEFAANKCRKARGEMQSRKGEFRVTIAYEPPGEGSEMAENAD